MPPKRVGRPRLHPIREVLTSIFYVVRSGCAWRLLPHELPAWQTAYHYFFHWRRMARGSISTLSRASNSAPGSAATPSRAQASSTANLCEPLGVASVCGYDGAKRVNGRKRHILVDTGGLILRAKGARCGRSTSRRRSFGQVHDSLTREGQPGIASARGLQRR